MKMTYISKTSPKKKEYVPSSRAMSAKLNNDIIHLDNGLSNNPISDDYLNKYKTDTPPRDIPPTQIHTKSPQIYPITIADQYNYKQPKQNLGRRYVSQGLDPLTREFDPLNNENKPNQYLTNQEYKKQDSYHPINNNNYKEDVNICNDPNCKRTECSMSRLDRNDSDSNNQKKRRSRSNSLKSSFIIDTINEEPNIYIEKKSPQSNIISYNSDINCISSIDNQMGNLIGCVNYKINMIDGLFLNGLCNNRYPLIKYYKRSFIERTVYLCEDCFNRFISDSARHDPDKYIKEHFKSDKFEINRFMQSYSKFKKPVYWHPEIGILFEPKQEDQKYLYEQDEQQEYQKYLYEQEEHKNNKQKFLKKILSFFCCANNTSLNEPLLTEY